ncbi:Microtubule-associated tumor suppressor candidate 2 -like protein [Triplophysa tibetana]|uniref:Microtubule-associated tumor suppressor candidate 2-like protein n=1 Tax=Triplophysa tibetana TaxID=1572043 RepID=A0A5A9MZ19_9TELE|nr:Microtubule-associated tumor suppressor candidate 2 -like protein [Triplophysa tibetana]
MSVNEQHVRSFGTSNEECCREARNNNRHAEKSLDGDANANEIQKVDGGTLVVVGTSSSMGYLAGEQVKIVIQCTDSPCEDPELAEFEMLESQELEDEDKNTSPKDVKMCPLSKKNPETNEQDSTLCLQSLSKEIVTSIAQTEVNSENDIFESCFSTMSSLGESFASAQDHISRTQSSTSWHASSGLYRILSEDLTLASQSCLFDKSQSTQHTDAMHQHPGKNTMHMGSVDLNLNSTTLPEEPLLEAQQHQPATDFITCESSGQSIHGMRECSIVRIINVRNESGTACQDNAGESGVPVMTEDKDSNLKKIYTEAKSCYPAIPDYRSSCDRKYSHDCIDDRKTKFESFNGESSGMNLNPSQPTNSGGHEPQPYKKQASFEKTRSSSSLERRKPWGSPSRHETPQSPKPTSSPRKQPPASPARIISKRESSQERSETLQKGISSLKQPCKSFLSSSNSIPKPSLPQQPRTESEPNMSSPPQKPKNVRPKIITYVRKNPQVKPTSEGPYEVSTLPPRLTPYVTSPAPKEPKPESARGSPVLSSSNILCDQYRQDTQRSGYYSPPGGGRGAQTSTHDAAGVFRLPRALRPQLGLGAVTRQPATKNRTVLPGQRSASPLSYTAPAGQAPSSHQEPAVDQKRLASGVIPKFMLPKPGQSGLRPPGFSHLPPGRLAAFGFVRSASVSSVSSNQSNDSAHSDPCRSSRPNSGSEDTLLSCSPLPSTESRSPYRGSPPPPTRRSLLLPPRGSPVGSRKDFQRDEITRPIVWSPKRFAVISPKPQSPVRQKSCVARLGGRVEGVDAERERLMVQKLRERCEDQAKQLISLQDELRKSSQCLDVFTITTQHFCQKNESAAVKERELSLQLARFRDEVVVSVQRWERLQSEKVQLEQSFERELKGLQEEQQKELKALQERLLEEHSAEIQRLRQEQRSHLELLRTQHQEQIEEMSESHETALIEMEATHSSALATLQEEHNRTVKNLKMAHEQQKKSMEEEFEKLRLSLQDQVDTLTFQNRSLRDRAKRFEEALRRSTDEQMVDALAPYQHIEEDLKSLKEVLEMKNQQIHQQELKISELEKLAQKNVLLEERIQVLQQQNEDLKDRIDRNLAMSRQLSEENANLQVYVEKESNEKKRLSRNNEELMWRLQTGELSPRMSPTQSPLHRPASSPASPSRM